MTLTGFLLYCLTYFLAVAAPGPGSIAIVTRVLSQGLSGIPAFIAGFIAGDLVWFTCAATGLSLIAQTFHSVFIAIKYAGALYLLYLAYRFWTAPAHPRSLTAATSNETFLQRFLSGFAITLGNPKVMVFYLALLPTVVDLATLKPINFLLIAITSTVLLSLIFSAYALTAQRARRLFTSSRAIHLLNRSTGAVMAGTAIAVARQ